MTASVMTYVVYWRDRQVMKVGRTRQWSRLRAFEATGAQVMVELRNRDPEEERYALADMRQRYARAFATEDDARDTLPRGRGFTECFTVREVDVMDALDTTAGVSSESTPANINSGAAVANGKILYLEFGTAYTEANHQCIFELWGYAL